ncbi:MAG: caspase family protein, partial [Bacteroidota bacterium]
YDINKDGIRDVLIGSRNGTFYSIDGASGQLLWRKKVFSGIHSSAIVNNYDSEKVTILVSESYGEIHTLNLAGGVSSSQRTSIGLFSSPIICQGGQIVAATSWFGDDDDGYCVITNENTQDRECKITGKISASPLYGDVLPWIYPNVILVTENGKMYVLENDGNQLVGDFDLPAGVEATPIITDVNNNGVNDILIAARDGFLYAYETKGDGKVIWGQFRGNNFNTGVLIDEEAETSFIPTKQMSVKGKLKSSSNLGGIEVSGRKKAIVIGISDYSNLESVTNVNSNVSLTDLQYADNDANSFAEFLETSEISGGNWDITLLTEEKATRARIMSAIDEVMTSSRPEDLIYLFFSGHGRQGPNDGSEIYFMTRDSDFKDGYSGVSYDWIKDKMSNSKADHIVFFVDACRSGVIGYNKGTGAFDNQMLQLRSTKPNKVIFSSGRGNQLAFEDNGFKHGIFTYFLLSGLKGAAPEIRRDNYLDLEELGEYVENQVRIYTRRNPKTTTQVPVIWTKEGFIAEGFPIAIRR